MDIDLEKFFGSVNHDILMAKLAQKLGEKRALKLRLGLVSLLDTTRRLQSLP